MENYTEKSPSDLSLRSKEIRILVPGYFDMIHAGHSQLIQEAKHSFKRVYLILGLIADIQSHSLLALHEKIETFRSVPEIDEICVLSSVPTQEDLDKLNIDYLATSNPNSLPTSIKILLFDKKVSLSTDEIIARVIRDYDVHIDNLLQIGYHRNSLSISKASEVFIVCKRNLKKIKYHLWRGGFSCKKLEDSIESARKALRKFFSHWSDTHEKILENWMKKFRSSSSVLYRVLNDIWENA